MSYSESQAHPSRRPGRLPNPFMRELEANPVSAFRTIDELVESRAAENDWREFKGAHTLNDEIVKRYWSENLSAFANSGGGLLIWGIVV